MIPWDRPGRAPGPCSTGVGGLPGRRLSACLSRESLAGELCASSCWGVMLAPTLAVIVWMSVFGGLALHGELTGQPSIIDQVNADYAVGTVAVVRRLGVFVAPFVVVIAFLLFTWLVTSIDSATLVICTLLKHDGAEISALHKTLWGLLLGVVTGLLMYVGGVTALQAASIVTGLPIGFLLVAIGIGVLKEVRRDSPYQ